MLFMLLLQLISVCEGSPGGVEYETLCISNTCFTLHMDRLSFEDARLNCVDKGGYLMTVRDRAEEAVLRSLLSQIGRGRLDEPLKFWIGLKLHKGDCMLRETTLRGFKWVSENETEYSNWEREPKSTCTEARCVRVHYSFSGHNSLKWSDGTCNRPAFYACKFSFQGMCKPLTLLGPGQINYTAPFSAKPLRNDIRALPMATYADILCADRQSHFSICKFDGAYTWTEPGPFCSVGKQNCAFNNGGCEHLCREGADGVRCACKDGYELDQDALSCKVKSVCGDFTCEHQCVMGESGYSCACPRGFRLEENQRSCADIDECQTRVCEDHFCVNTPGSYICECKNGYEMVDGKCRDVDECTESRCEQSCLNSLGSFSCHCNAGFTISEDGYSCVDIDECLSSRCESCTNTIGSFSCECPSNHYLDTDGITCTPHLTDTSTAASREESHEETSDSLTVTTIELQHQSPHTDAPLPELESVITHGDAQGNVSLETTVHAGKPLNSRVLICVLGSVIPLVLLLAVTLAIAFFRCGRSKKETKKTTTADGYCWVSSGFEPHLEKLYESIRTDDL